jgi:cytoskeletal protein RodZ
VDLQDAGGQQHGQRDNSRTGATLAKAREAAGLQLADVARETRVPLRHLKAIESDNHDALPALPYALGFVKAYARAVGLDPETLANQFRSETSKLPHVPTPRSLEPLDERRLPTRGLVVGSIALVVAIIAGLSAWGSGAFDPATPAADVVATETIDAIEEAPAEVPAAVAAAPAMAPDSMSAADAAVPAAAVPGAVPASTAGGPVIITAREDVWVKIYDAAGSPSDKIGIMKAGERFQVPADRPGLMLWTGKAGALSISVAGRQLPPLGGMVETVRNVSLAPADLLARSAAAAPAAAPPA